MARKQAKRKVTKTPSVSKNWFRYLIVISLVILAFAAINWKPQVNDTDEIEITTKVKVPSVTIALTESSNPTAKSTQSQPLDEATRTLAADMVNEYFKGYMGSDVAYTDQLNDFVVHSIAGRKTASQLLIEVNYSVKPNAYGSLWYSGNGSPSNDGWIHNKYGCTVVNKTGETYTKIDSLGTGCGFNR